MDAFELMGKVSRKGGGVGGGREGRGGRGRGCAERVRGGCVRAVACLGVRVRAGEGSPRSDC